MFSDIGPGQRETFFILSSQQAPNQELVFFFFFFFFPPWADAAVQFLVRAFMLGCKYLREERVTSLPPDLLHTDTHTHTHTHTHAPLPLFCITLIGAQGMQPLPDTPLLSLALSLSVCVKLTLSPVYMSKSHFCLFVTSVSLLSAFR